MEDSPTPTPLNKLKSLQNLLALSAVTLIITVWATVSFLAYQNSQFKNNSEKNRPIMADNKLLPTPTDYKQTDKPVSGYESKNTVENTINSGSYRGWVEFTDYDNGYSIKFPPNVYTRQNCIGEGFLLQENKSSPPLSESRMCDRDHPYHLEISINNKPATVPITDKYYKVTVKKITIDGIPTNIYVSDLTYEPGANEMQWREWFKEVFVEKNGKYYNIYFQDKENEKLFDQILSTFKFLDQTTPTLTPAKKITPTPTIAISNWKTYINGNVEFSIKYPPSWKESPSQLTGNAFSQEIKDQDGFYTFEIYYRVNYNTGTGKPYNSLQEHANMPYPGKILSIDGVEAMQYLPRAGSENVNSIDFFSKDKRKIYSVALTTGKSTFEVSMQQVTEGQKLFDQILSTFKFVDQQNIYCFKNSDCPEGYGCSTYCDVNAPGGADCYIVVPPPTCINKSP